MGPAPNVRLDTLEQWLRLKKPPKFHKWRDPRTCRIFPYHDRLTKAIVLKQRQVERKRGVREHFGGEKNMRARERTKLVSIWKSLSHLRNQKGHLAYLGSSLGSHICVRNHLVIDKNLYHQVQNHLGTSHCGLFLKKSTNKLWTL